MKLAILFMALMLAACVPIHPEEISDASPGEEEYKEVANVAGWGLVQVSDGAWNKHRAVDGDSNTWWSAHDVAPQWLEVELEDPYLVESVEFSVSQVRPGPAAYEITLKDGAGETVFERELASSSTSDGDTFVVDVEPPKHATSVRIVAKRHEGWVAYREVRIVARLDFPILSEKLLVTGLNQPVFLTHAGDGSGRLFVLEREGRVRIIKDGVLLETPLLDISHKLSTRHHHGLLGLAFPSDYGEHGRFYVTYTSSDSQNTISRFAVGPHLGIADPASEEVLLAFEQPGGTHTAGTIAFGPKDGYLYVAVGDGYEKGEESRAQSSRILLGKILRIDVGSHSGPYTVPPDNPFAGSPDYAAEIWALGLRNPWGFAFDRLSGDLFISDSGENEREEVNFQPAGSGGGENYGWPHWEGDLCRGSCELENLRLPVMTYDTHGREFGCAVVGGAVYYGQFIYADFCTGKVWALGITDQSEWKSDIVAQLSVPIRSIGADEAGNVYAVGYATGSIYELVDESSAWGRSTD